jgi:hypothetical protein
VIVPTSGRIDESSGIQLLDQLGEFNFGVVRCNLTPALVVNNLEERLAEASVSTETVHTHVAMLGKLLC